MLPKSGVELPENCLLHTVIYGGHKVATRREEMEENWHAQIEDMDKCVEVEVEDGTETEKEEESGDDSSDTDGGPSDDSSEDDDDDSSSSSAVAAASAAKKVVPTLRRSPRHSPHKTYGIKGGKPPPRPPTWSSGKKAVPRPPTAVSKKKLKFTAASSSDFDSPVRSKKKKQKKKKKNTSSSDFDSPVVRKTKKKRNKDADAPQRHGKRQRRSQSVIHMALEGDVEPLLEYIEEFDMSKAKPESMTATEWGHCLPSWKTKEKKRGLTPWKSTTKRGQWEITGVCAKVINKAVQVYMNVFGLPPVVEGERRNDSVVLCAKAGGMDLFKPFVLTVHLAYCKYLNPEVEQGMIAFDRVLQYMHTKPVRLKLLRAVRTSRHPIKTPHQDTPSRHPIKTPHHFLLF